ncbi:YidC/Oxa1 family membrane protein insertase [Candidatus Woesearchaeota archaeon]|nr:YidC/Oxa1 family membrane protein insertase [Candidatus Woesearchaeota archaeon]
MELKIKQPKKEDLERVKARYEEKRIAKVGAKIKKLIDELKKAESRHDAEKVRKARKELIEFLRKEGKLIRELYKDDEEMLKLLLEVPQNLK